MRKFLILLTILSLTMVFLAIAALLEFGKFDPQAEVVRTTGVMASLSTVQQASGFSWTRGDAEKRTTTTVFSNGGIRLRNDAPPEHATEFRLVRVERGNSFTDLSGELRGIGSESYLTYHPPGPLVEGMSFANQGTWVQFAEGGLRKWGPILPSAQIPLFTRGQSRDRFEGSEYGELLNMLQSAEILHVRTNGETEDIRGVKTRILEARIDEEAAKSLLVDMHRIKTDREPNGPELLAIARQAEALETMHVRLWIGLKDHYLYRLQSVGIIEDPKTEERTVLDMRMDFSAFNEPVNIAAPSNSLSFHALIGAKAGLLPEAEDISEEQREITEENPLLADSSASLPVQSFPEIEDRDGDGLSDILETFYGTNHQNPDTDGDGVNDGDEVLSGRNPKGSGSLFGFGLDS